MKMKIRLNGFLLAIVISTCLVSCNGIGDFSDAPLINLPEDKNFVPESIVYRYITAVKGLPSTRASQTDVVPVLEQGDTVMYLVNYPDGGWELLSADKRIPTRLMVGEEGSMSLEEIEAHPGMSTLLNDMRYKIHAIMHSDQEEPVTDVGVLWDKVAPDPVVTSSSTITWLQIGQETVRLDSVYVGHLVSTHWGQQDANRNYNKYVPYTSSNKRYHCPAGCAIVAAAQVAAYLNKKMNITTSARFLEVNCSTYYNGTPVLYGNFTPNPSTYVSDNSLYWRYVRGEMGPQANIDDAVAVLLAFWGWKLEAEYSPAGTYADLYDIPDVFHDEYGISCDIATWNSGLAISQIVNNKMPVIVSGHGLNTYGLYDGHAWIVDGYYHCTTLVNYYYQGFDTSNPSTPLYKTIQEMVSEEEYFLMNWGWGNDGVENTYITDSSGWTINGWTFSDNNHMVYRFAKI